MLLVGRLDFVILLSNIHVMSKFRFKLESSSFRREGWDGGGKGGGGGGWILFVFYSI